eukprot:7377550-Prymnesium_polylepis.2
MRSSLLAWRPGALSGHVPIRTARPVRLVTARGRMPSRAAQAGALNIPATSTSARAALPVPLGLHHPRCCPTRTRAIHSLPQGA